MNGNIFGVRLKELRIQKGLQQIDVAKVLNCSYVTISRWEMGVRNPSLDDIVRIANYFNVTTDYLLGLQDF